MQQPSHYPCPVCGGVTTEDRDYADGTLMESEEWCDDCGYRYEYGYGNSVEYIGDMMVIRGHDDSRQVERATRELRQQAIMARRNELAVVAGRLEDFSEA